MGAVSIDQCYRRDDAWHGLVGDLVSGNLSELPKKKVQTLLMIHMKSKYPPIFKSRECQHFSIEPSRCPFWTSNDIGQWYWNQPHMAFSNSRTSHMARSHAGTLWTHVYRLSAGFPEQVVRWSWPKLMVCISNSSRSHHLPVIC